MAFVRATVVAEIALHKYYRKLDSAAFISGQHWRNSPVGTVMQKVRTSRYLRTTYRASPATIGSQKEQHISTSRSQ
jgi:hypothetical protein